jgi:hypothetical protein
VGEPHPSSLEDLKGELKVPLINETINATNFLRGSQRRIEGRLYQPRKPGWFMMCEDLKGELKASLALRCHGLT